MKQTPIMITLGIIQIIILSLFGMYFYRLKHTTVPLVPTGDEKVQTQSEK
ncbi:MAG: hypothetical protein GW815_00050 [Candidatus Moranbacteria bacterium]|nr:hypothetical protein [Candidatus Moranbacteria bacterium]